MAASSSSSASLSLAVAHAISFLTRPLSPSYSANVILKLQLVLDANLTALYAPLWVVKEPLRNSGRRCLTLSPKCLPPRAIYSACIAAGVQWFDWIAYFGGREFDLFVDPGCVSISYGGNSPLDRQFSTVWAADVSPIATLPEQKRTQERLYVKTTTHELLEADHEDDDQLFAMIAHEISAPTWMTPVRENFPAPVRSLSPLSTISAHSRSSSRSSNSSSGYSCFSADTSGSISSMSSLGPEAKKTKHSRRERARVARVFVDTTKTDVTPYDGGKTTVLTGGVMLGGAPGAGKPKMARPIAAATSNWRSIRA